MRLRVTNTEGEAREPSVYFFEQDRVTIGRGRNNDLTLSDPERIVSSEHAEIRRAGQTYQLVDRGSTNFTYLHGQQLKAGKPYELTAGDVFRIGNFKLEFTPAEAKPSAPSADETAFAPGFSNPLADPAEHLLEALNEISEAYEQEAPQRRNQALKDAIRRADADVENHEAAHQVLAQLGISPSDASGPRTPSSTGDSPSPNSSQVASPRVNSSESSSSEPTPPSKSSNQAGTAPIDEVLDTALEALSRIVEIPWQFRHEFIGQTIVRSAETQFLYEGDAGTMKEHLLDPRISQEERRKRLAHVEDAAESLAVHQVAMLNGYKASVMKGTEQLLEQFNPDVHRAEIIEENAVYKYFPSLASPEVLDRVRAEWNKLKKSDWSAAEQRIFRPAFIKAYLGRMTAVDAPGEENAENEPPPPSI